MICWLRLDGLIFDEVGACHFLVVVIFIFLFYHIVVSGVEVFTVHLALVGRFDRVGFLLEDFGHAVSSNFVDLGPSCIINLVVSAATVHAVEEGMVSVVDLLS